MLQFLRDLEGIEKPIAILVVFFALYLLIHVLKWVL